MENNEQELNQLANIDMEIDDSLLDEDDSFGLTEVKNSKPNTFDGEEIETDDRPVVSRTGIKINLSDDDCYNYNPKIEDDVPTLKSQTIKAMNDQQILDAYNNTNTPRGMMENDMNSGYWGIDMECSVGEDDDFEPKKPVKKTVINDDFEPELTSDEIVEKTVKQKKVTQGKVEADYWDRLSKKHKESNKKGAHNLHVHYGGDPKLAMDMFNHDMSSTGKVPTSGVAGVVKGAESSYTADISSGEMSGSEGMACCGEKLEKSKNRTLFENLLVITGFKLIPNGKTFILKDQCDMLDDMQCSDEKDCINQLQPYIDDTFITPLQCKTGEKFKTADEWVKWYNADNQKKYPKCKEDIEYCKMIANYLK